MAKRSSPFKGPLYKNTTMAGLVTILVYLIIQLVQTHTQPAETQTARPSPAPSSAPTVLPQSNEPVQLYSNQTGDNLTQLFVDAINGAQKSITFVIYALMDPQVIDALRAKSEAGIPVFIVCDAKASPGITKKLPQAQIVRRATEGLVHQKILIIDSKLLLLGSANMTTESLRVHGNLVVVFENQALAETMEAKAKSMDEDGGAAPLKHVETMAGPQHVELWELPDDPGAVKRIRSLLQGAKKSIRVAMFTWTRLDFTQDIIDAAKRGVKVEVVIDRYSGKGASAKIVRMFEQSKIPTHLSGGHGLLHHKFAEIDEEILINGSANWTNSAFKVNDDYFLIIYPLTPQQQNKMNQVWQTILKETALPYSGHPRKGERD